MSRAALRVGLLTLAAAATEPGFVAGEWIVLLEPASRAELDAGPEALATLARSLGRSASLPLAIERRIGSDAVLVRLDVARLRDQLSAELRASAGVEVLGAEPAASLEGLAIRVRATTAGPPASVAGVPMKIEREGGGSFVLRPDGAALTRAAAEALRRHSGVAGVELNQIVPTPDPEL
jgi:hypothetical protein